MTGQLDTSGSVGGRQGFPLPSLLNRKAKGITLWSDLDPFTQGYIEALFEALADKPCSDGVASHRWPWFGEGERRPCERCGLPITGKGANAPALRFSDLAPETLARIIEDCGAMLPKYPPSEHAERHSETGRSFWKVRQAGHLAPAFPKLTVTLGDDGKVRLQ